jgi:phosphatidylinositol glycan class B
LHPALFATVYKLADVFSSSLKLAPANRANVLLAAPKLLQAVVAAVGDYYTWKLAKHIHGAESHAAWATLALTVVSPWQWFCSTRTLSNCLETTLTIIALYNWPWHWSRLDKTDGDVQKDSKGLRKIAQSEPGSFNDDEIVRLDRALLFAAVATVLRPTNIMIWLVLVAATSVESYKSESLVHIPWTQQSALVHFTAWQLVPSKQERLIFVREGIVCGSSILVLSAFVDRLFYQEWVFPPFNFLYINVVQSLAVFYGNNNWHYYLSEGYPLLLTTALPFTLLGIFKAFTFTVSDPISRHLATICIAVPAALSLISHKEVRFIYPLLPAMHILAAPQLASYFGPALSQSTIHPKFAPPYRLTKRILLGFLLILNIIIAMYTATVHNSGLISVTHYLRHELEIHYLPDKSWVYAPHNLTAAFFMPCHSTPWRSHLQYLPTPPTQSSITAWALTCEPPLNMNPTEKSTYLDEADLFYLNPSLYFKQHMSRHPPLSFKNRKGVFSSEPGRHRTPTHIPSVQTTLHDWPEYLVFFAQLERTMQTTLQGSGYGECARIFNSQWHDDWRRTGDVVVWCLYPERAIPRQGSRVEGLGRGAWEMTQGTRDAMVQMGVGVKRLWQGHRGQLPVTDLEIDRLLGDDTHGLHSLSIEKPFWKQRPKDIKGKVEAERWWHAIPGLRPKRRKSWWEMW